MRESTAEERREAFMAYDPDYVHLVTDDDLELIIQYRIYDDGNRPEAHTPPTGWISMDEACRRPSMEPLLVALRLRGDIP